MPTVLSCSSLWTAFSPIYWCGFFRGSRHQSDSFALSGVGKTHKAATLSQDDCFYWPPPFWVVGWPQAFRSLTRLQIYSNPVILGQWHWLFFLLTGKHLAPGPITFVFPPRHLLVLLVQPREFAKGCSVFQKLGSRGSTGFRKVEISNDGTD